MLIIIIIIIIIINKLPASTCHRCRCSRWEKNCCWFVWKFKAHILDCTILQLGLHILLFGLHKIGWTALLEYALERGTLSRRTADKKPQNCTDHHESTHQNDYCNCSLLIVYSQKSGGARTKKFPAFRAGPVPPPPHFQIIRRHWCHDAITIKPLLK